MNAPLLGGGKAGRRLALMALVLIFVVGGGVPAGAQRESAPVALTPSAPAPVGVRGGLHDGFSRLVFDWPTRVGYGIESSPGQVIVRFDRRARLFLAGERDLPLPEISGVTFETIADGTLAVLAVADGAEVKSLRVGSKVVIDVGRTATSRAPRQSTQKPSAPASAEPQPAAGPVPAGATDNAPVAKATGAAEPAPPPDDHGTTAESADTATTVPAATAAAPKAEKSVALSFRWSRPTAAAVFRRGDTVWAVFDRPSEQNVDAHRRAGGDAIAAISQVPSPDATILRLITTLPLQPSLRRDGLTWIMQLGEAVRPEPGTPVEIERRSDPVEGTRLFLPVPEPGRPVVVSDPDVGDNLVVLPVIPLGYGLPHAYQFPQVNLLDSAQGLVVQPLIDDVRIRRTRGGIEIGAEVPLHVSPLSEADEARARLGSTDGLERVLDLDPWFGPHDLPFAERRTRRVGASAVAGGDAREAARKDVASLLLAHGLFAEAMGVADVIGADRPASADEPWGQLVRGIGQTQLGRPEAASGDLAHVNLKDVDEGALWRLALAAEDRPLPPAWLSSLERVVPLVSLYPPAIRLPLTLTLAEAAIDAGGLALASDLLQSLPSDRLTGEETGAVAFVEGLLLAARGDGAQAMVKWRDVVEIGNRRDRFRASLALIDQELKEGLINEMDAIATLEQMRLDWRGDALEFALLDRLAELHLAAGNHADAMRAMRQAATYLRGVEEAKETPHALAETFQALFLDGGARSLPPLTAVALYDEFRELTPSGDDGNAIISHLADRLVEIDLLDRAAALLDNQVRYRLTGDERIRVGTRLALVHLLNDDPEAALDILDETGGPKEPTEERARQRQYIRAQALADLGRDDEALALLGDDESVDADRIRASILRRQNRWRDAMVVHARLLKASGAHPGRSLTEAQAAEVLNTAVSIALAGEERMMETVQRNFGDGMEGTAYADAFRLIAGGDPGAAGRKDAVLAGVTTAENFQTFLSVYRDRLETTPLSEVN